MLAHQIGILDVDFSPDGSLLATASRDDEARLFDVASGEEVAVLVHEDGVNEVDFSPDGSLLATASWDGSARLFDTTSGEEMGVLRHKGMVRDVEFSPDGSLLATASEEGVARLWRIDVDDLVSLACRILIRNLTEQEWATYVSTELAYRTTCANLSEFEY